MQSMIPTILGTAALGLLKKQQGSSIRLSTAYRYSGLGYFDVQLDECLKAVGVTTPIDPDDYLKDLGSALRKLYDTTKIDVISPSGIKISISTKHPAQMSFDIRSELFLDSNKFHHPRGKPKKRKYCNIMVLFDFTFDSPIKWLTIYKENTLKEELDETVKSTFLQLLREGRFESSVLSEWSKLENWGPAHLADGHWFSRGNRIIVNADTGEEYKPSSLSKSRLRKR